jgi:hypothetical protein
MVCIEACPAAWGMIPKPKASTASEWRAMEDNPCKVGSAAERDARNPKPDIRNNSELIEMGELGRRKCNYY